MHAGNELLWLDGAAGRAGGGGGGRPPSRNFVLCDWMGAAAEADLLVLNRGMHCAPLS